MVDAGWAIEQNKRYGYNQVEIRPYCRRRMEERGVEEELLISTLFSEACFHAEEQERLYQGVKEKRYELIFKISSKYCLIIIVKYEEKVLKVINVIKTTKDLEKKWRQKMSF